MTVRELRDRMGADEHVYWQMYFARQAQEIELRQRAAGNA